MTESDPFGERGQASTSQASGTVASEASAKASVSSPIASLGVIEDSGGSGGGGCNVKASQPCWRPWPWPRSGSRAGSSWCSTVATPARRRTSAELVKGCVEATPPEDVLELASAARRRTSAESVNGCVETTLLEGRLGLASAGRRRTSLESVKGWVDEPLPEDNLRNLKRWTDN